MEKLISFYKRYEHLRSPTFFVGGFLLDLLTLGSVDEVLNIGLLSVYLLTSFFLICIEKEVITITPNKFHFIDKALERKDEIFHFIQGTLLSAFTLFYFKSASLATSLLFMTILVGLLLINELTAFQRLGTLVKSILFALSLLSFILVYLPLAIGQIGLWIFILAIIIFIFITLGLAHFFKKRNVDREKIKKYWLIPAFSIAALFLTLRLLKWIPPVPLSLEYAGVYHKIEKKYPQYKLYHLRKWWKFWHSSDEDFSARAEDKVYFFTRVFAPSGFEDDVMVHWQKYVNGNWESSDRIKLSIIGGRQKGFRGYTYKSNYTPGQWRVLVETQGALEIGRFSFTITEDPHPQLSRDYKVTIDK